MAICARRWRNRCGGGVGAREKKEEIKTSQTNRVCDFNGGGVVACNFLCVFLYWA